MEQLKEQLQENLITFLDSSAQELLSDVCEIIINTINKMPERHCVTYFLKIDERGFPIYTSKTLEGNIIDCLNIVYEQNSKNILSIVRVNESGRPDA